MKPLPSHQISGAVTFLFIFLMDGVGADPNLFEYLVQRLNTVVEEGFIDLLDDSLKKVSSPIFAFNSAM